MKEKQEETAEFLCACVASIVDRKNRAEAEIVRLRKRVGCLEDVLPNTIHIHALAEDICRTIGTDDLSDAAMEVQRLKQIDNRPLEFFMIDEKDLETRRQLVSKIAVLEAENAKLRAKVARIGKEVGR